MATDFTITVDYRPGGLASIGEALANAGVNIEGVSGLGFEGRGIIHICVVDAAKARQALDAGGLEVEGEADAIRPEPVPAPTSQGRSRHDAPDRRRRNQHPGAVPGHGLARGRRHRRQRAGSVVDVRLTTAPCRGAALSDRPCASQRTWEAVRSVETWTRSARDAAFATTRIGRSMRRRSTSSMRPVVLRRRTTSRRGTSWS